MKEVAEWIRERSAIFPTYSVEDPLSHPSIYFIFPLELLWRNAMPRILSSLQNPHSVMWKRGLLFIELFSFFLSFFYHRQHPLLPLRTMKTAWFQVKFDLENQSRIRTGLAQNFIERVDKPIMEFKDKQKKSRKDVSSLIQNLETSPPFH